MFFNAQPVVRPKCSVHQISHTPHLVDFHSFRRSKRSLSACKKPTHKLAFVANRFFG